MALSAKIAEMTVNGQNHFRYAPATCQTFVLNYLQDANRVSGRGRLDVNRYFNRGNALAVDTPLIPD